MTSTTVQFHLVSFNTESNGFPVVLGLLPLCDIEQWSNIVKVGEREKDELADHVNYHVRMD